MAQATNGQTKAGTAGKKTERVLVHQKGGRPEDHLDRLWMDGISSKAPGRTAASPEQTLDHLEWSNSKVQQCTPANCSVHVTEKRGQPPGPNDPSWMDGVPSKAPGVPAGSFQETLGYLEWSYRKVHQGPQAGGCPQHPQGACELKRSSKVQQAAFGKTGGHWPERRRSSTGSGGAHGLWPGGVMELMKRAKPPMDTSNREGN